MIRTNVPQRQMLPSRPLLHLFGRRVGIFLEQRDGRDDEARRAEAAHQAVGVAERLLHRMQRAVAGREAVHGADLLALRLRWRASSTNRPCGRRRSSCRRRRCRDRRRACCRSGRRDCGARRAASPAARSSKVQALAVDHQRHRHSSTPTARAGRSAPRRPVRAVVTAVARLVTPALFKKSLRLTSHGVR